jgi:hypothetical protein
MAGWQEMQEPVWLTSSERRRFSIGASSSCIQSTSAMPNHICNAESSLRDRSVQLALRSRIASDYNAISGNADHFDCGPVIDVSTITDNIQILVAKHRFAGRTQS